VHPPDHIDICDIWVRDSRAWWMRFAYATLHYTKLSRWMATRRSD